MRYKVLAIPYFTLCTGPENNNVSNNNNNNNSSSGDGKYYLVVRDRVHSEMTFISGGVKSNETLVQSALREIFEETRMAMAMDVTDLISITYFDVFNVEDQSIYRVFFFNMGIKTRAWVDDIVKQYSLAIKNKRFLAAVFNETDKISFANMKDIRDMHLWGFIKDLIFSTMFEIALLRTEVDTFKPYPPIRSSSLFEAGTKPRYVPHEHIIRTKRRAQATRVNVQKSLRRCLSGGTTVPIFHIRDKVSFGADILRVNT